MEWLARAKSHVWESGLTCAGVATAIFSLSALQVKLTGGRVPVLQLCVVRSSISFGTSLSVGAFSKITPLFGHRCHLPLLFLRGLFGTAAFTCSYIALLNLPLGDAVTLSQLRPPVMAVVAYLLLGEPLGWSGAAGCLTSLAGATIVSHPPFLTGGHTHWSSRRLLGTLCGVAGPCFGAGAGYCIRRIQKQEPALVVALWFHTVTIGLLVWPLLAGWPQQAVLVGGRDAALLLGISCSSFCAQLLMTRAFQLLPAARAASLNFLGVVYSHALGVFVFGEELTLFTLAGGLLIFAGVLLVACNKPSRSSSTSSCDKAAGCSSSGSTPGSAGNSSSSPRDTPGTGSSSREDAEAAVPLKHHHDQPQLPGSGGQQQPRHSLQQQQQQQQHQQHHVPDTSSRGVRDQAVHHRSAPVTPRPEARPPGTPPDMGLGVMRPTSAWGRQQQQQQQQQQHGPGLGDEEAGSAEQQPLLLSVDSGGAVYGTHTHVHAS